MNETNTTTTPPVALPEQPAAITSILAQELIDLILATPQEITVRGLLRQKLNLAIPRDLFQPGNGQAIIDWILTHYKPPQPTQPGAPAPPRNTIPVSVEFDTYVSGRVDFSRRDFYKGTIHIPIRELEGCCDEEEIADVIRSYVNSHGTEHLDVDTYGDTDYGDIDHEDTEISDECEINSDITEILQRITQEPIT